MGERPIHDERKALLSKIDRTLNRAMHYAQAGLRASDEQNGMMTAWTSIGEAIRKLDVAKSLAGSFCDLEGNPKATARVTIVASFVATAYYVIALRDKCQMINAVNAALKAQPLYDAMLQTEVLPRAKKAKHDRTLAMFLGQANLPGRGA